jgi:uncharacterized protein (TIGR04255 family)
VENFPNPPIQEAILDIFATLPQKTTLETLGEVGSAFKARYPKSDERAEITGGFEFKANSEPSAIANRKVTGYLFRSEVEQKVFQVRIDGFTFNKLRLYKGWKEFSGEARELWNKYRAIAKPVLIPRLNLRYVNRIEIPFPFKDFRDYCLLFPEFPAALPQLWNQFFMTVGAPVEESSGANTIINLTFEPPSSVKPILPLLLDISITKTFESLSANDEGIWDTFESFRNAKNRLFSESLTEETKKLFR